MEALKRLLVSTLPSPKNVSKKSGGKLTIVTHAGGSLYKGGEIFRAVRTGQAQIGERFMSALGNEDALYEIDSIPFLATSFDDAMKLYKASKKSIVKSLDSKGLVFLYAVPWPAQGLYSKKEIKSTNDLKGLKFRAYNPATVRIAELTGMTPTKIEVAEVSQAFSTGTVESMITSPTTGKDTKIWENGVKYFYDIAAWYPKNMVIVNKAAWKKLDSATQKLVLAEAAIAEQKGWAIAKSGDAADKKTLASNVTFISMGVFCLGGVFAQGVTMVMMFDLFLRNHSGFSSIFCGKHKA